MERQKRCVAVHDISCFGKCSLTVALPILSSAGIECAVIPTAILSTHTGGFRGYTYRDLTDDIIPIARHWKSEGISFDAFYTGYLGSSAQIEIIQKLFKNLDQNSEAIKLVDPVMGDHGRLYNGFAPDFPKLMRELSSSADIICPNITEASLLTDCDFEDGIHSKAYIEEMISKLSEISDFKVVLTGVKFNENEVGAAVYDGKSINYVFSERIDGIFHGTGDVFASTLLSALLREKELSEAAKIACEFTADCVNATKLSKPQVNYGVRFEAVLPTLFEKLN